MSRTHLFGSVGVFCLAMIVSHRSRGEEREGVRAKPGVLSPAPDTVRNILADYDAELRKPDGHVDNNKLLSRLRELGVNTYFWLIWHASTDFDDLRAFLPKAAQVKINVWVYLVPPSESPPHTKNYSEPFRIDYRRWAREIADLSTKHPNLTAWVIDDFFANRSLFTPKYLAMMRADARRINPKLAFLPLMYYREITRPFLEEYAPVIDGVVAAYPADRMEIKRTRTALNGDFSVFGNFFSFPGGTASRRGDFVAARQSAAVQPASRYSIRFRERDNFTAATAGYHFKILAINGQIVWQQDVAGGTDKWRDVIVDVTNVVRGRNTVRVEFGLADRKGVSNFGVTWSVDALRADGLKFNSTWDQPARWRIRRKGKFETSFGPKKKSARPIIRRKLAFIVMPAGHLGEFQQRHGGIATPRRLGDHVRMCLDAFKAGECDGVVTYALDKRKSSTVFPVVKPLFQKFRQSVVPASGR